MEVTFNDVAQSYYDEVMYELFNTNTLVNVAKLCCQEKEFKGEYYGIPQNFIPMISNERNEYISLLTLISDKLNNINRLNLNAQKELSCLNKDSNYCCR